MDFTLNLNMILDLPNKIMNISAEYDEYSELLRKKVCESYDLKELRENVERKFNRFKDTKYLCKFPIEPTIKITPTYELKEEQKSNSPISKVEQTIMNQIDNQIWIQDFYNAMLTVAIKLTKQEATYLVDSFFKNKSEDFIAEKLQVCKMTLQNIKKSCLIKIWIEIRTLNEDDY